MTCFKNIDIQLTRLLRLTVKEPPVLEGLFPTGLWSGSLVVSTRTHVRFRALCVSTYVLRHTPRKLNGPAWLPKGKRMKGNSLLRTRPREGIRDAKSPPCAPPASAVSVPLDIPCRAAVTCGNSQAGLRAPGRLPESPCSRVEPEAWSLSPHTQPCFHHLSFIQRLAYPIFPPCCLCNEKLSTRSLIKFSAYPTPPCPKSLPKKREGRLKPGTHLAKGTLVNKKVTHHELQVTPPVILNPLPGDLAQAEFDFMNCEVAMLKVCKLDINWTQKTGGAEWFSS